MMNLAKIIPQVTAVGNINIYYNIILSFSQYIPGFSHLFFPSVFTGKTYMVLTTLPTLLLMMRLHSLIILLPLSPFYFSGQPTFG